MSRATWRRSGQSAGVATLRTGHLVHAAARGAPLEELIELAARSFLQVSRADRVGVWLETLRQPGVFLGTALEPSPGFIPETWKSLDLSLPFFRTLLEGPGPVVMEVHESSGVTLIGPLVGMETAVWIPLQAERKTLGLALLAFAKPHREIDTEVLQSLADEVALVVAQRHDAELLRQQRTEMAIWGRLQRAILRGAPANELLSLIAAEIARYANAEFVAVGRGGPPERLELLYGSEKWRRFVREPAVVKLCAAAAEENQPVQMDLQGARIVRGRRDWSPPKPETRVAALGLESCGEQLGVLLAGLLPESAPAVQIERLEFYSILALTLFCHEHQLARTAAPEVSAGYGRALIKAEEKIRQLEAELLSLMDSLEAGVLLFDAEGQLRMVNDRFGQLLGMEVNRIKEAGCFEALVGMVAARFRDPPAMVQRWRELVRRGDEASWDRLELILPTRKVVERLFRPVKPTGERPVGWLEVYRETSEPQWTESRLRTEKLAALGQLVSGIAHELNNPLTSIVGYAQLLLARQPDSSRGDAQKIYQEAERAGRIVKNLLLFTREAPSERRSVNLNEIVEHTIALRHYELRVENIAVELDLDPELPHTRADASQLQQVVLNLIVNAEQAIQLSRGQGRIHIRTRRSSSERVALEVADDGPGIAPEIVPRIFDPFFTTKPAGMGTGLGLSIVYGIVQEHDGQISVESQPGQGARFTVELPVFLVARATTQQPGATETGLPAAASEDTHEPGAERQQRVLVVEDEPTVAQLIADVLREEGHQVETVLDTREAFERVRQQEYDLVICDLKMPQMDGRAFYRALVRAGSPLQHRLVFVTGDTLTPHTLEFLEHTGLPYLAKPFLVEELKLAVERALEAGHSLARVGASMNLLRRHEPGGGNDVT